MIPFLSISSMCSFSNSFSFTNNLLALCLIGFSSPVSIVCFTMFVLPISYLPLINISSFFRNNFSTLFRCDSVNSPILYLTSFSSSFFNVNIFLISQYPISSNLVSSSQQYASLMSSSLSYSSFSSSISLVNSIGITRIPYFSLILISSLSMSIFLTFLLIQSLSRINNSSELSITSISVITSSPSKSISTLLIISRLLSF